MDASRPMPPALRECRYTRRAGCIRWSMEYLDAYLIEEKKKGLALPPFFRRPRRFADNDGEVEISFVLLPSRWLKRPGRLKQRIARLQRRFPPRGLVWYEDRLRDALEPALSREQTRMGEQALPESFWMARFYREQPFRENLIVLLPGSSEDGPERLLLRQERWMREFLGEDYGRLNGLLLVSDAIPESAGSLSLTDGHSYYRHIYQDTGLPVIGAGRLPEYFRKKAPGRTICVDAGARREAPVCCLPGETIYLDMTSDAEKERLLYAKRRDVCYRSLRMYLDTFVRKRYNTNRCKSEGRGRRQLPSGGFMMKEQERE